MNLSYFVKIVRIRIIEFRCTLYYRTKCFAESCLDLNECLAMEEAAARITGKLQVGNVQI